MTDPGRWRAMVYVAVSLWSLSARSAENGSGVEEKLGGLAETIDFVQQRITKTVADGVWFQRFQGVANVEKVRLVAPPPENPIQRKITTNGVIVSAYTFMPARRLRSKLPLIVLLHTEIHGDFNPEEDYRVTRELVEQGYAVIAPDYRGSTGYGADFWRLIDYGGLENEDAWLAREWMLAHHQNIDRTRVGIMGWSHGGSIALMNILRRPEGYAAAYAGMPVTDLLFRLRQKEKPYQELFSAPYHIGKTVEEAPEEYLRRSAVRYAAQLERPLLIHAVTNDEDVNRAEVERMAAALRSAGKRFEYRVYTNAPGGHAFNKLDTAEAEASRREIYRFLAKYLKPAKPLVLR